MVRNALRAGLAPKPEDWPGCSACQPSALATVDGPLPLGPQWLQWVNQPQSEAELRRAVARGCPYGSDAWRRQTARELGIEHTLRTPGRQRAR